MLKLMIALLAFGIAQARSTVGTTGISSSEVSGVLSQKEFASRFQVTGDLFVTSADGKKLFNKISGSRTGKPAEDTTDLYSNWGTTHKVGDKMVSIFIRYGFQIQKDASVKVHIQQFDSMTSKQATGGEVQYGKLLREEKFDLVDFAPINWIAFKDDQMRVVARITPLLLDKGHDYGPDNLPIAMEQAILVDGNGKLWGDDISHGGGKFVAIATRNGTLAVSYFPFKGASEIGLVKGHEMLLTKVKPSLTLRNSKPFLTANGEMKVYGMILGNRKTSGLHSIHMSITDKENEFIESLK